MIDIRIIAKGVKTCQSKFCVDSIDLDLSSGDILGLVGRSGSGKSTLLKTIIGFLKIQKGWIKAYKDNRIVPIRSIVGYSPQENSLFPFLTLEENLITFGRLHNLPRMEIDKSTNLLLKRLDLGGARKKKIVQLSGGMQKRADLAVTLMASPDLILMDEPFAGLDISLQRFIWDLIKDLARQGRIIILSSHQLGGIQHNCNKIGLIEKGLFYNTQEISDLLLSKNEVSLEIALEKIFRRDMRAE